MLDQPGARRPLAQPAHRPRVEDRPRRRGPAQPVALAQRDLQALEGLELAPGLDALGQQPGVDAAAELAEQLGEGELHLVAVGAVDEGPVQLDEVRAELRHLLQARVAGAGVVEGQQGAAQRELVAQRDEWPQVADGLVLGQLGHERPQVTGSQEQVPEGRGRSAGAG